MKRKSLLFLGLLAFLPFATACNKQEKVKEEPLTDVEIKEVINNLKDASQKVKNVKSTEEVYISNQTYGEIQETYVLNKKIYDDDYSIGSGTGHYVQGFAYNITYALQEQVFRSGNYAILIHDGTDSGQTTLSFKKTQSVAALKTLIYSGVDTEDINLLKEVTRNETIDDDANLVGLKRGKEYVFRYTESEEIGGGDTFEMKLDITCRKSGLDYSLLAYRHYEARVNHLGDVVQSYLYDATYTNASNGNFVDVKDYQSILLNPKEYAEAYPQKDVEEVTVKGNLTDRELSFVSTTQSNTAKATSAHIVTEMTYLDGQYAGIMQINDETVSVYPKDDLEAKPDSKNVNGFVYGTGTESYCLASNPTQPVDTVEYYVQEGIYAFDASTLGGTYRYRLIDYGTQGVDDDDDEDPGFTIRPMGDELTSTEAERAVVDLRDQSVSAYSSVIGQNYYNVSYAAVKDEVAQEIKFYMNLAFSQEDEDNPAIVQQFVVTYDLDGMPQKIEYFESAFYETNIAPEKAYYEYRQVTEYSYDDEVEPREPLDVKYYLDRAVVQ